MMNDKHSSFNQQSDVFFVWKQFYTDGWTCLSKIKQNMNYVMKLLILLYQVQAIIWQHTKWTVSVGQICLYYLCYHTELVAHYLYQLSIIRLKLHILICRCSECISDNYLMLLRWPCCIHVLILWVWHSVIFFSLDLFCWLCFTGNCNYIFFRRGWLCLCLLAYTIICLKSYNGKYIYSIFSVNGIQVSRLWKVY